MIEEATPAALSVREVLGAWRPIDTAPRDGRPVWARGNNWGAPECGYHCCWVWWDGEEWRSADATKVGVLEFLCEWLPRS